MIRIATLALTLLGLILAGCIKPRREEVGLELEPLQLEPGWHDRPKEGRGTQGRQGERPQELERTRNVLLPL